MKKQKSPRNGKWSLERLLFFVGVGLVAAIVLLLGSYPMIQKVKDFPNDIALEKRVVGLEEKIGGIGIESRDSGSGEMARRLEQMASDIANLKVSQEDQGKRLDERTSGMASRMDILRKELERKKAEPERLPSAPSAAPKAMKTKGNEEPVKKSIRAAVLKKNMERAGHGETLNPETLLYHQVRPGDTFYSICRVYGISLQKLKDLNHFDEKTRIRPGQKIVVGP